MHIKRSNESGNMQDEQHSLHQVNSLLDFAQNILDETATLLIRRQNEVLNTSFMMKTLEAHQKTVNKGNDSFQYESDESDHNGNSRSSSPTTKPAEPKIMRTDDDDKAENNPVSFGCQCQWDKTLAEDFHYQPSSTPIKESKRAIISHMEPYQNDSNLELENETIVPMTSQEIEDVFKSCRKSI